MATLKTVWRSLLLAGAAGTAALVGACGQTAEDEGVEVSEAELNRPSREMLDYLFNPLGTPTVEKVAEYLERGARLEAKDAAGATAFSIACENISQNVYIFREGDAQQPARIQAFIAVALFLIEKGADVNAPDGRGITPMFYLTQFVPPDIGGPVVQAVLARTPNLDMGEHRTAPVHLFAKSVGAPPIDAILANRAALGLDLTRKTSFGQSVAHLNARRKPLPDGTLPLQRVLEMLPAEQRAAIADGADDSGASPFVWAAAYGNMPALEYLLATYPVDVQRRMTDGANAADLAARFKRPEALARLATVGVTPTPAADESTVVCDGANAGLLTYARLERIITTCRSRLRSLDDLLPLLPASIRSNHLEFYAGRGLQEGSFKYPRVVMYERDGGVVLAFNGERHQEGYKQLEVQTFDKVTRKFELREIDFSRARQGEITFSEPNPTRCTGCHGKSARPLWDTWTTWAGMYGGDDMVAMGKREAAKYQSFLAIKNEHPRYKTLLPQHFQGIDLPTGPYLLGLHWVVNEVLNQSEAVFISNLSQSIAREMGERAELKPYRFAVLAALSCNQPIEDFVPATHRFARVNRSYASVEESVVAASLRQMEEHFAFTDRTLPGGQVAHEVTFHRKVPRAYPDVAGFNRAVPQMSKLRYVVEGVLGDGAMAEWSNFFMPGGGGSYAFHVGSLETMAWKDLLSETEDADVYAVYTSQAARIAPQGAGYISNWIGQGSTLQRPEGLAAQATLCPLLKSRSQAALSH